MELARKDVGLLALVDGAWTAIARPEELLVLSQWCKPKGEEGGETME